MSQTLQQKFKVEDQDIHLDINLVDGARFVSYEFSSPEPMHPVTIAMSMLCIAETIFIDNKMAMSEVLNIRKMDEVNKDTKLQ